MANPKDTVIEHLQSLKSRGIKSVKISDEAIATLKKASSTPRVPKAQVAEPKAAFAQKSQPMTQSSTPRTTNAQRLEAIEAIKLPKGDKQTQWNWLRDRVINDPIVSKNVREGKQAVFGVGNLDSPIFFCGEAPGADEETQGIPFVGRAGQLLRKIISAMDVSPDDVYIGNILNWRPQMANGSESGNRPPTVEEMTVCLPFLKAQVEIVKPKVIVALGATAVTGLLGYDPDRRMGKVRGQFHDFDGTDVMITYHPSYLLRNNTNASKRVVWEDILKVMERVGMPITAKQKKFFT